MSEECAKPVDTEIDKIGEEEFLAYKRDNKEEEEDLVPVKIVPDYKVEKRVDLESLKVGNQAIELVIYQFKDDERSKAVKPCICYVTRQTSISITFEIHEPTSKKLKSAFLACIVGYDAGKVEFVEKDTGSIDKPNEWSVVIDKKPEFKEGCDKVHAPCRLSSLVTDNDDFKLFNVDLKQSVVNNVCFMTVSYALWNTQIALYGTSQGTRVWSEIGKIDYEPHPQDKCSVVFYTPKLYESFQYYHKKLILLAASYGESETK